MEDVIAELSALTFHLLAPEVVVVVLPSNNFKAGIFGKTLLFLGTMLGFQQMEVFFPSAYETTFNDGSLSQFFFLLVRLISNYSDPNRHIFALHELTVCWNCC